MTVDPKLLEILVCPLTRTTLRHDRERQELLSRAAGLAYPIRGGMPIMLAGEARDTLDALIAANPKYRSSDGHLLYARALEAMGETAAALHEYETLAPGYPGEEGRARYAQLLLRDGQRDKAQAVFNDIIRRSSLAPDYYRRDQRECQRDQNERQCRREPLGQDQIHECGDHREAEKDEHLRSLSSSGERTVKARATAARR